MHLIPVLYGSIVFTMVAVKAYRTPFVNIGPQDEKEDAMYLYTSILQSYKEYQAAKEMGEKGLIRAAHVCYPDHGCYYKNGTSSNFWALPSAPEYINTTFYLYTSGEQSEPQVISYFDPRTIKNSNFRSDKPTTVLIHGFGNSAKTAWMRNFQMAVFKGEPEGNYILVDWGIGAKPPNYWAASANTQIIGTVVAKMICSINSNMGTNSTSFHLIGYSLGAHAAGFTAQRLAECGHTKVGRITALDPAGPIFDSAHESSVLSPHDADFVTGIHGNGVDLVYGGFGLEKRVGHIDFYPNGGQYQPGCDNPIWGTIGNLLTFNFGEMPESIKCNHHRVIDLAIESAEVGCGFTSYPCDNYQDFRDGKCTDGPSETMGLFSRNTPSNKRQYLLTKGQHAFCADTLKITLQLSQFSPKSSGALFVTLFGSGIKETTEEIASEEEDLNPGKNLIKLVPSQLSLSNVRKIGIMYEPKCGWISCSPKNIYIDELIVENINGQGDKLCSGFAILFEEQMTNLTLSKCGSSAKNSVFL